MNAVKYILINMKGNVHVRGTCTCLVVESILNLALKANFSF